MLLIYTDPEDADLARLELESRVTMQMAHVRRPSIFNVRTVQKTNPSQGHFIEPHGLIEPSLLNNLHFLSSICSCHSFYC